jgi:hypothetical protein
MKGLYICGLYRCSIAMVGVLLGHLLPFAGQVYALDR